MKLSIPKPMHGWREFAGEIAIVVIGVLIALGAQQMVGSRDDRARADNAVTAIRQEVADHDFSTSEIEIAAPCIFAQLDVIQKRLLTSDRKPIPRYSDPSSSGYVVRMPHRLWQSGSWQSVNASDVLRRVEPEFHSEMAGYYDELASERVSTQTSVNEGYGLNSLSVKMPDSGPETMRYIETIERMRGEVSSLDLDAGQLRDSLAKAGRLATDQHREQLLRDSGTIKFCRAHGLPLAKLRPAIAANAD